MTDNTENEATAAQAPGPAFKAGERSQSNSPFIAILLAVVLAGGVGLLVFRYQEAAPPWLLAVQAWSAGVFFGVGKPPGTAWIQPRQHKLSCRFYTQLYLGGRIVFPVLSRS